MNIYEVQNRLNGKRYIGKTEKRIEDRFAEHIAEARRGGRRRLCQAIRKHGSDAFVVTLLETCYDEDASTKERSWIATLKTRDYQHGYNMTAGGEGKPGSEITAETRDRLSVKAIARISTMTDGERIAMTAAANSAKRGAKEKPSNKSQAQRKRWTETSLADKKVHGQRSSAGISPENKRKQAMAMNGAFSPARVKGQPQPIVCCPHCKKVGGRAIMGRYHFERCKFK